MTDGRQALPVGTQLTFEDGRCYCITGEPIGYGGGSILYPAAMQSGNGEEFAGNSIPYVIKECYPVSFGRKYHRQANGEIIPERDTEDERAYLHRVKEMQIREGILTQEIYQTALRMLPVRECSQHILMRLPEGEPAWINNTVTVMDSLVEKGRSIREWLGQQRRFAPELAFRIIQQLLYALQEVHRAGYLHLDIQDGNVFLHGSLGEKNELVTLIDFGSARPLVEGRTPPITDRVLFTSVGFSAPELFKHNDGSLQLGPEADLYSVGCLTYMLLTGDRPTQHTLLSKSGKYLKPNHLSRMKCPVHLVDRVQTILRRALEPDPENRYHSVEEMLEQVTELIHALRPYQSDICATDYDAFVCYKHGRVDSDAALTLQRALENYRPPRGLHKKEKPFQRVFVDEGELSSCADFGEQIREALKNSAWLIVICSPDTPSSPWVEKEIEQFLKFHDRSRILAVLTGGDPETSFPAQLMGAGEEEQVLAADARGDTLAAVKRKLRGDALLKLAAPMLGTSFDSLKQRQKLYTLQKAVVAAVAGVLFMAGFAAYAQNRASVIENQKELLAAEFETSLLNESRFLTQQALRRLEENDVSSALELALAALPSEEQERPVLPEAQYVLSQALALYRTPVSMENTATLVRTTLTDNVKIFADACGDYLFTFGNIEGGLEVWRGEDLSLAWTFQEGDWIKTREDLLVPGEDMLIAYESTELLALNYSTGEICWQVKTDPLDDDAFAAAVHWTTDTAEWILGVCLSPDGNNLLICTCDEKSVWTEEEKQTFSFRLIDSRSGELLQYWPDAFVLPDGPWIRGSIGRIALSSDGSHAALVLADSRKEHLFVEDESVVLLDLKSGKSRLLPGNRGMVDALFFLEHDGLALLRHSGGRWGFDNTVSQEPIQCQLECYDLSDGSQRWKLSQTSGEDYAEGARIVLRPYEIGERSGQGVLFIFGDQVLLLEPDSGELLRHYDMTNLILDVQYMENGIAAMCADGQKNLVSFALEGTRGYQLLDEQLGMACLRGDRLYSLKKTNRISTYRLQKYRLGVGDNSYRELFALETSDFFYEKIIESREGAQIVLLSDGYLITIDPDTGYNRRYAVPEFGHFFYPRQCLGLSEDGTQLYLYSDYSSGPDDSTEYYALELDTGELRSLGTAPIPLETFLMYDDIFLRGQMYMLVSCHNETGDNILVFSWNLESGEIREVWRCEAEKTFSTNEEGQSEGWCYYRPQSLLWEEERTCLSFAVSRDGTEEFAAALVQLNLKTGEVRTTQLAPVLFEALEGAPELTVDYTGISNYGSSPDGRFTAFRCQNTICIIDDAGGECIRLPLKKEPDAVCFAANGKELLVLEPDLLSLYSLPNGIELGTVTLSDYCTNYGDGTLYLLDQDTVLFLKSGGGLLIDLSQAKPTVCAELPQCIGYDAKRELFFTSDPAQGITVGSFPHHSLEEMLALGRERLAQVQIP